MTIWIYTIYLVNSAQNQGTNSGFNIILDQFVVTFWVRFLHKKCSIMTLIAFAIDLTPIGITQFNLNGQRSDCLEFINFITITHLNSIINSQLYVQQMTKIKHQNTNWSSILKTPKFPTQTLITKNPNFLIA